MNAFPKGNSMSAKKEALETVHPVMSLILKVMCVSHLFLLLVLFRIVMKEPEWIEYPIEVTKKVFYFLFILGFAGSVFYFLEKKFIRIPMKVHYILLVLSWLRMSEPE